MIEIIGNNLSIVISEGDVLTYHHVGGLDSGMCYITGKNGKVVYAGDSNFALYMH